MGIRRIAATASVLFAIAGAAVVGPIAAVASPPIATAAAAHLDATGAATDDAAQHSPAPLAQARLASTGSGDISHPVGAALGMLAIGGAALGLRVARRRRLI